MDSMINTINNLVSISSFNKGDAGKIFQLIKATNQPKLVLRRNEPECVLLSPKNYTELINELEDLRDYKKSIERLSKSDNSSVSFNEALKQLNLSESDLNNGEDIEFE